MSFKLATRRRASAAAIAALLATAGAGLLRLQLTL
jgi:hypothetical protein